MEALRERFFVTFHPGTVRRKLLEMGYVWKRTRYVPSGRPREEEVEGFKAALREAKRVPRAWGKAGRVKAVAHLEGRFCGVAYLPRYSSHLNPVETIW